MLLMNPFGQKCGRRISEYDAALRHHKAAAAAAANPGITMDTLGPMKSY